MGIIGSTIFISSDIVVSEDEETVTMDRGKEVDIARCPSGY